MSQLDYQPMTNPNRPLTEQIEPAENTDLPPILPSTTTGQAIGLLSDSSLTQLVNGAFRNYQSILALSRSPLANSALVTPTLIVDDVSPTAEESGRGLRLVLRWAVEQMAPRAVRYPQGQFRPFDDETWSDPLWWRYNILRHRYVEPLHPDDFIDGGRYTETLMALTGITSSDAFFDERNRAIREVADILRQQLLDGAANQVLQQMALAEIMRLLDTQDAAAHLLGIATTFDDIFPRTLLLQMTDEEQVGAVERALTYLVRNRLLLSGDDGESLWLSPTLRAYIYRHQPPEQRQRRHRTAARYYEAQESALTPAKHWHYAGLHERAATMLLEHADALIHELQLSELSQALQLFDERDLPLDRWREVQILLSDLYHRSGQPEEALAASRRALKITSDAANQARIYRRLGKLYEKRNQLHALGYYQQAEERFEIDSPELAHLLKDRGWLYILQKHWSAAEQDLLHAQAITPQENIELCADIADALASLFRHQKRYDTALTYAQQSLALREQLGTLPRIASSFNNLGLIYQRLGEYWQAISAYEEALITYRKLDNKEAIAGALLNIGSAFYMLERYEEAIHTYHKSLELCQKLNQAHIEAITRYNLAEAYAALNNREKAHEHWLQGYNLSQHAGFSDQIKVYEQLQATTPILQIDTSHEVPTAASVSVADTPLPTYLSADEQTVLALAQRAGQVSAKLITEQLDVSRATATRRLSALAEAGHLTQHGKGRGVYYTRDEAQSNREETGPNEATTATLLTQLAGHAADLRERFGVATVEPALPAVIPTMPRLVVHFTETPTLAEFLELRTYIQQATGVTVDLVPVL